MEVSGQLHALAALPPGKEPPYPLDRRLVGPQSRCGRCGEGKNLLPLSGIESRFLDRPTRSLVAIPTEQSRLKYNVCVYGQINYLDVKTLCSFR
jgi:hypothetical protein